MQGKRRRGRKNELTGLLVVGRHVSGLRKGGSGGSEGEVESSSSRSDVAKDPHMSCCAD